MTLLAHDPMNIKGIVYEMRFDEVSAQFAEFGEFYIGLQLPIEEIFGVLRRLFDRNSYAAALPALTGTASTLT